tara:strand:+ start:588 stop:1016 length:429 start_codon:yes stop_codon:yes gene_type:complete
MTSSYSNITQNITKKKEKELSDNDRLLINGYTIIRKNKNKIVKVTSKNTERKIENIKKEIEEKNYNDKCYNSRSKMINNWNNFRDTENSLSGDLSRFYNYKNELNNMLEEEEFILEKMNIMNINYMSDSDNSDDDMNKNLLY